MHAFPASNGAYLLAHRFVVISGCSGGGKSTLLAELKRRGYAVVEEPGRRVIAEELASGGTALPWIDLAAFLRRVSNMALADRTSAAAYKNWVFFDRSLVDAVSALDAIAGSSHLHTLFEEHRYHRCVFMTPPWPDIYVNDADRRHGFDEAVTEYDRLARDYPRLGYETIILPKVAAAERANLVLSTLDGA